MSKSTSTSKAYDAAQKTAMFPSANEPAPTQMLRLLARALQVVRGSGRVALGLPADAEVDLAQEALGVGGGGGDRVGVGAILPYLDFRR